MTSLRDDVIAVLKRDIYADASGLAPAVIAHHLGGFETAADAIIQAITTRLTSEEAVREAARELFAIGPRGTPLARETASALVCIQAAIGRATHDVA